MLAKSLSGRFGDGHEQRAQMSLSLRAVTLQFPRRAIGR